MIQDIIEFRRQLHRYPDLSGDENNTAQLVKDFLLKHYAPDEIIENVGGHGIMASYHFDNPGATVMVRCELDALPIHETTDIAYRSTINGKSHKCGHDGHMAIVSGLIFKAQKKIWNKGRLILLFQPAEETGKGAEKVCADSRFRELSPDYILALHNLPGLKMHSVAIVDNFFSATVQSFAIHLKGEKSHAAEPNKGNNPALALADLIDDINRLNYSDATSPKYTVYTPIYSSMGEKNYGVSASNAELHYTVRTWGIKAMKELENKIEKLINDVSGKYGLQASIHWFEYFPSASNDSYLNEVVRRSAQQNNLEIINVKHPFKFGEDFGWFSTDYKVAMFGLGSGEETAPLHHSDYDFPDELIQTGIDIFSTAIGELL